MLDRSRTFCGCLTDAAARKHGRENAPFVTLTPDVVSDGQQMYWCDELYNHISDADLWRAQRKP